MLVQRKRRTLGILSNSLPHQAVRGAPSGPSGSRFKVLNVNSRPVPKVKGKETLHQSSAVGESSKVWRKVNIGNPPEATKDLVIFSHSFERYQKDSLFCFKGFKEKFELKSMYYDRTRQSRFECAKTDTKNPESKNY